MSSAMDDISDDGMRFYGSLPTGLTLRSYITGKLFLPDGPMRFSAEGAHSVVRAGH